jgi:hypothetical protein
MFTIRLIIKDGLDRWTAGLAELFRRKGKDAAEKQEGTGTQVGRHAPVSEGERALHQAMGWSDDAWENAEN